MRKPKPNSIIRRDCYWYSWGGEPSKGFFTYPREYGAHCFHPKVKQGFANHNGDGIDRIVPNCDGCPYCQSEKQLEAEECLIGG